MPRPFDASALTEPVDRAAVAEFGRTVNAGRSRLTRLIPFFVVAAIVLIGGPILFGTVASIGFRRMSGGSGFGSIFLVFAVGMAVVIVLLVVAAIRTGAAQRTRWYRLSRFAAANAMTFVPEVADPALPGMIFSQGSGRRASDLVRGTEPRFVEFANYRYATGSGKNRRTHRWGYIAVRLDAPLPHIVLDAVGNNALFGSNLPAYLARDQHLSLEGDFDRYFQLYCPRGYERDALYLFTPDIMARFIDNAAVLDVEIVDDWLFLYCPGDVSTLDEARWAWLFATVGALLDKLAQWGRWRDERLTAAQDAGAGTDAAAARPVAAGGSGGSAAAGEVGSVIPPAGMLTPPPGVAQPGRRLARSLPWKTIIAIVLVVGGWIALQSGLLHALVR